MSCKICEEPLVLRLDPAEDEAGPSGSVPSLTVPDDLELRCGCHFHWQCFLDESSEVAISLKCPSCKSYLPVNSGGASATNPFFPTPAGAAILARYSNEGGVQEIVDLLPSITEEAYLEAHPEARPARAMHIMCAEGDVTGIVELLQDVSDEVEDLGSFIRYQDPLSENKSGLHLAIERSQEEAAWLLLWLSSTLSNEAFPGPARQAAESMGVGRLNVSPAEDIRGLEDGQGRKAKDIAERLGGIWGNIL